MSGQPRERVMVGMSGGVDSSVSALLLQQQGHAVEGLFMFNWSEDEQGYCTAAEDFQDARRVCDLLSIPLHQADFSREYRERVFANFLEEYAAGRTPNPDVLCNREIKFRSFLEHARRLGADRIATGHYARLAMEGSGVQLQRAHDPHKDQTYFLCTVPAEALALALFPVGGLLKTQVRKLAADHGLPVHDKKDSTGICFIGERRFREFLAGYLPAQPGPICEKLQGGAYREIGQHQGLMYYTLGQRRGLGIGGLRDAVEKPWYVVGKEIASRTLWVSQDPRHPDLMQSAIHSGAPHWIGEPPELPLRCSARIRHRHPDQPCEVRVLGQGLEIVFDLPQQAPTPGQYIALYDGERCLGGAVIEASSA